MRTVRVPVGMEALFARAEEVVSRFFRERVDRPENGTIEIFGERYLLIRAASLSVEFFGLVRDLYGKSREAEADDFARNILFDLAHAVGKQDAQNFAEKMDLSDPIAQLSAGPVHFSHTGWAFVDISPASRPEPGPGFFLIYDHPYSFESDAWARAGRTATFPVCIMNAGYSSGWCEASFGMPLVATEVACRARGDAMCRFIMAPPAAIEEHVAKFAAEHNAPSAAPPPPVPIPDFFSRKRAEEDLRRRFAEEMAERERAERELRQAQKLEAVGRLAGGIAHDFNNLMAIVIARASLIERHLPDGDPIHDELEHIIAAGERAAALTRQLLAFSRSQVLDRRPLELNTVVGELTKLLTVLIGEDVELQLHLHPEPIWVEVDRGQLDQVLTNLVVNARDAMSAGGALTIATAHRRLDATSERMAGDYAVLTVADRGRGMSPETIARVFEPFFTTKEEGKGSGLGLATVYGIVRQSGGHIEVTSDLGHGARFTVLLPRIAPPSARPTVADPPLLESTPGRGHILLVEDNHSVRRALSDYLRDEGFVVLEAADGPAALALADDPTTTFELMLTDVIMPRMSGRELAIAMRAKRPATRILFMSGYTPDQNLLDGFDRAALLAKPFRPEMLSAKLRELLS